MTKRFLILLFAIGAFGTAGANQTIDSTNNLTANQVTSLQVLGKVWGFLKYYHPNVATGQLKWDNVLVEKIPAFLAARDANNLNELVDAWLNELGKVDECKKCDNTLTGRVTYNFDTAWITHSGFTAGLENKLKYILANRYQGKNYYVSYGNGGQIKITNEELYAGTEFQYPSAAYRLLTLFRYWNIVNYFSPYKYITSKKWDTVLAELIPLFYQAKDDLQYQLGILKMFGSLEDGHSTIGGMGWSQAVLHKMGEYSHLPFYCSLVEGKAVVTWIANDSLCKAQGIALNDVIVAVDGESIAARINRYLPFAVGASNAEGGQHAICIRYLFAGNTPTFSITKLTPKGDTNSFVIARSRTPLPYSPLKAGVWKMLANNIGYMDLGGLMPKDVDNVMDSLAGTQGIIIDIRNYPNNTWPAIIARLSAHTFKAPPLTYPDLSFPGLYKYSDDKYAGKKQSSPYAGKVVLLVNEQTKSHGEYSAMMLQGAAKTTTVGSITAGADGNVTELFALPGGFSTRFSGLGVYYPDGTVAQKTGIKIDIVCKPTIKGVQQGRDELIETGIKVINGK